MTRTSKDHVTYVRMTDREREALRRLASTEGRNMSDMVREMIRREAKRVGVWPTDGEAA
jgi:predicted DNA-binding protein